MDTGQGRFTKISEDMYDELMRKPALSRVFREGEILEIKGSKFRVERIKTRGLRLILMPDSVEFRVRQGKL